QTASVGSAFLIVPLRSLDALRRLRPDPAALPDLLRAAGARRPYAFTLETLDPGATVHTRMRDVDREDPATGSAAGALGAYLAEAGRWKTDSPQDWGAGGERYSPASSRQTRSTSATPQAWATQPRGRWGASPSRISETCPSPASLRWCSKGRSSASAASALP